MKQMIQLGLELLKRCKRALTRGVIRVCNLLFRLLPVQNRAFFYTIRADGRLLENLDCVYQACACSKVVFAHMLPHGFLLSLRARRLSCLPAICAISERPRWSAQKQRASVSSAAPSRFQTRMLCCFAWAKCCPIAAKASTASGLRPILCANKRKKPQN